MPAGAERKDLILQVDANIALAQRGLAQLARQVEADSGRMDRSLASVDGAFTRMGPAIVSVRSLLGTLGIAFSAVSAINFGRSLFETTAGLTEQSRAIGVSVEQYQILKRAVIDTGGSVEGMERGMAILNRTLGQARAGVPAAAQSFRALGIDPEQFSRAGDVLPTLMERIARLRTESEQAAAAQRFFGRGAAELIPLLVQGADGYQRYAEAAQRAGLITSEMARRADEAADRFAALSQTIQTRLVIAASGAIDFMSALSRGLQEVSEDAGDALARILGLNAAMEEQRSDPNFLPNRIVTWVNENVTERISGALGYLPERGREARARSESAGRLTLRRADGAEMQPDGSFRMPSGTRGDLDLDLSPSGARRTSEKLTSFMMPVSGPVSSGYGLRGGRMHEGMDIAVPVGTQVRAPAAGTIVEIGNDPGGWGRFILIDHGNGTSSRVAHLSREIGVTGQFVAQGEVIALSGGARGADGSGNSRGPHVHYEVLQGGQPVDPRTGRFRASLAGAAAAGRNLPPLRPDLDGLDRGFNLGGMTAGELYDIRRELDAIAARGGPARAALEAVMQPLPDLDEIMPEEDRERLLEFAQDFNRDLTSGLAQAVVYGRDLGDALVNSIQRAAATLLESSLMDLLSGRTPGESMIGQLLGFGGKGQGVFDLASLFGGGGGGSYFGGSAALYAGARAGGGPVSAGRAYLVGEHGPEMIMPKASGVVIPNHAMGGSGTAVVRLELSGEIDARIVRVSGPVAVEVVRAHEPALSKKASAKTIGALERRDLALA